MSDDIKNYISSELDIDITENDELLSSGLIDSISIMKLIAFIEEFYNLKIPPQDMIIENFNTVTLIESYLQSLQVNNDQK